MDPMGQVKIRMPKTRRVGMPQGDLPFPCSRIQGGKPRFRQARCKVRNHALSSGYARPKIIGTATVLPYSSCDAGHFAPPNQPRAPGGLARHAGDPVALAPGPAHLSSASLAVPTL